MSAAEIFGAEAEGGLFKGSRKYSQQWNVGYFLLSLRRGEEKVTGQWILSLNFLGQLKGTGCGVGSQM